MEARRVTTDNRDEIIAWVNRDSHAWPYGTRGITWHDSRYDGLRDAFVGDWVIRTAWGEFQALDDDAVFARFESVI